MRIHLRNLAWGMTTIATTAASALAATPGTTESFNAGPGSFGGGSASNGVIASGGVNGVGDGYYRAVRNTPGKIGVRSDGGVIDDFSGDLTAAGVGGFSFWLNDVNSDDPITVYVGVGASFLNFWIHETGFTPPHNEWQEFSVDTTSSDGWVQVFGTGTFEEAVANSDRLLFRHDAPGEIGQFPEEIAGDFGVDEITVLPAGGDPVAPVPMSSGLSAVGFALMIAVAAGIGIRLRQESPKPVRVPSRTSR